MDDIFCLFPHFHTKTGSRSFLGDPSRSGLQEKGELHAHTSIPPYLLSLASLQAEYPPEAVATIGLLPPPQLQAALDALA